MSRKTLAQFRSQVPMGTVTMTVNMTYAGEASGQAAPAAPAGVPLSSCWRFPKVLSRLRLSPNFYSIVADAGGQALSVSKEKLSRRI